MDAEISLEDIQSDQFSFLIKRIEMRCNVGASGVRSFETATFQGCTEPSRRTTKFYF